MSYFKTSDNVNLYYNYYPKKNKPVLVFVHGLGIDHTCWKNFIKTYKKDYGVLTLDLRGHGNSSKPSNLEDYKIERFVLDLKELLKKLNLKKYYLIGHSLGGLIISELKAKKYVLICTPVDFNDVNKTFYFFARMAIRLPHKLYKIFDTKMDYSRVKGIFNLYIKCLARASPKVVFKIIKNLKSYKGLKKVKEKRLVIISKYDEILKNHIAQIYSRKIIIKGNHYAPLAKYEQTKKFIDLFLK